MPATHCQGPHALAVASKALQATNESLNFSFLHHFVSHNPYFLALSYAVFGIVDKQFFDTGGDAKELAKIIKKIIRRTKRGIELALEAKSCE